VTSLEERLRIIDKERERILDHIKKARKERDDSVAQAEKEKKDAIAQLDSKVQQNKTQIGAISSSAPEHLVCSDADDLEPPSELCCCITGDLMDDPVTAMDGHTYERSAIEAWFSRFSETQRPTSPLTNEPLPSRRLIPSHNIRSQCKTWKEKLGIADKPEMADPLANILSSGTGVSEKSRQLTPNRSAPRTSTSENRNRNSETTASSSTRPRSSNAPRQPTDRRLSGTLREGTIRGSSKRLSDVARPRRESNDS
jgi:U-box domain